VGTFTTPLAIVNPLEALPSHVQVAAAGVDSRGDEAGRKDEGVREGPIIVSEANCDFTINSNERKE